MGDVWRAMQRRDPAGASGESLNTEAPAGLLGDAASAAWLGAEEDLPRLRVEPDAVTRKHWQDVRLNLMTRAMERRVQVIGIVSARRGDGRSTAAANLALAFAQPRGRRTLLICADHGGRQARSLLDRRVTPGLTEYLADRAEFDDVVHTTACAGLCVLPFGDLDAAAESSLMGPHMARAMDRARDRFDFVVVDTPPVDRSPAACRLASLCDQTLVLIRLGRTSKREVARVSRLLAELGAEVAGSVVVGAEADA